MDRQADDLGRKLSWATAFETSLEVGDLITEVDDESEVYRVSRTTDKSYWYSTLDGDITIGPLRRSPNRVVWRQTTAEVVVGLDPFRGVA